jgi:hypothetical protein
MAENFVTKTLDTLLEVVDIEFKIPLGFAEIKFPATSQAKEWWKNKKSRVEVEEAIRRAEENFIASHPTEKLAQILHEFPLYAENDYKKVVLELLKHLDEEKITWLAEIKLESEWGKIINKEEIQSALELYLPFLRHELNGIDAFREIVIARAIERMEKGFRKIENSQSEFKEQLQNFEEASSRQSELLLQQMMGISSQIAIQGLELSHPDDVTLRPLTFLRRDELIKEFQEDLERTTCLFLVDGSGKGKTQLAVSLYELWNGTNRYWISLRNKSELQDKHLRIQFIRWLYQVTGESTYWQRYWVGDITFREIVTTLGGILENSALLVIDDFPNPVDFENLYTDLEIIARTFSKNGSKIVATGQWGIPPNLASRFPSLISARSCPNFSLEEISELLRIIKIPSELQSEKTAALISAITKGHPSLVSATISWLEKQGEEFSIETLLDMLSGEPVKDTLEYSRKVLIKTLDDQPKELLYRLSLVGEKLDKKLIIEIANLSPVIANPEEQLDKLVGPWIDRLDRDYFDVSPLLSKVGENNIPVDLFKKTHVLCADRYLRTHTINVSDLLTIISHLWQAQDYARFANVLVMALMSVKTYEQAKYVDWACSLLLDINWPSELDLHWRILIRSAQLRVIGLAKGKYDRVLNDLESLIHEADIEKDAPILILASITIGFFVEELPLIIAIPYSFRSMQLIHSFSVREKEVFVENTVAQTPDMLWVNSMRIKDCDHIKLFLEEVNKLNKDIREILYVAPLAVEASSRMMDQIWLREMEKPQQERNWFNVLSFIDQLVKIPCVQESECLKLAVVRAKAVVYADHLREPSKAIEFLNQLPEINSSGANFLINFSKGCIALDAGDASEASVYFTIAENTFGDSFSYYRLATTRQLALSFEMQGEWKSAKQYCLRAIRKAKENNENLGRLEFCELLGELAYIHWISNDVKKACGAMYGLLQTYIKTENDDNLRHKEVYNKAGHALGWFLSIARWGIPPSRTNDGEEYAPVQPGFFVVHRPRMGEHVSPMGFNNSHILRQLALFAEGVGLLRMARDVFRTSLALSAIENSDDTQSQLAYVELATLETILGSPHQALQYGLNARKFFVSITALRKEATQSDYLVEFAEVSQSSKFSVADYSKAEERLLYAIFVPLFAKLIASNLNVSAILDELNKWIDEIVIIKSDLFLAEEWLKLMRYFMDLILFWKDNADINNEFMIFNHKTSFEVFKLLLGSERSNISLKDGYGSQVSVAITLPKYGDYAKYMFLGIGKFLHRYWLGIAQTRRFALHHPSMFLDELLAISPNDGAETIYQVLISAERALGVNLSENTKAELRELKKMAKPWLPD